jgi:outer membrane protein assembly factor BamB
LFAKAAEMPAETGRLQMWRLADAARIGGLKIPEAFRPRVGAPPPAAPPTPVDPGQQPYEHAFTDQQGAERLVLERRGDRGSHPHLLFVGARVRKRLDNKFLLAAFDVRSGASLWQTPLLRLKGRGQEPGFFEAFVHRDLVIVHGLYDVLALGALDGRLRWRYRVPFDFEIRHALLSGDLLVLAGKTETLALYVQTASEMGEVAWQVQELGGLYIAPYMRADRLVSVRKLPFSVTVRSRTTGGLIGRLELPDLSLHDPHPLLEGGPRALPVAHVEHLLAVSDGWYYVMIDTDALRIRWKRLIDANDITREPAMRFALSTGYFSVLKEDYEKKAFYLLSAETGEVLWRLDSTSARDRPLHSVLIAGEKLYGIEPHAGQGFYLVRRDCRTGRRQFRRPFVGYQGRPSVRLLDRVFGGHVVVRVADRQEFELRAFDATTGKGALRLQREGVGPFGVHGKVSATVQNGRLVLLRKDELSL